MDFFLGGKKKKQQTQQNNQYYQQSTNNPSNQQGFYNQGYDQYQQQYGGQYQDNQYQNTQQYPNQGQNNTQGYQNTGQQYQKQGYNSNMKRENNTQYGQYQGGKQFSSGISTQSNQYKSNLYPTLPNPQSQNQNVQKNQFGSGQTVQYTQTQSTIITTNTNNNQANIIAQALLKQQLGWGQEKQINTAQGQTKFVEQIGFQPNKNNQGGKTTQPYNANPADIWNLLSKGVGGQTVTYNQGDQGKQNEQNYNIYNNLSGYKDILQLLANFQENPIFSKQVKTYKFPNPYVRYKIIPYLDEKKALDVTSVNDSKKGFKKNNMIIWDYHGGPNQMFYVKEERDGKCYLINIAKGFAVKIPQKMKNQDSPLEAGPKIGTLNQLWILVPGQYNCYEIVSAATGKALDLWHEQSNNGTIVIQWNRTGRKNQLWRIVPA